MNKVPGLNSNVFFDPVGLPFSQVSSVDPLFPTGAIAYYRMDESSGAVIDAVSGNNGTNNGATPNVTGKIETAYEFDGLVDYINLDALVTPLASTTQGTWNLWVKPVDAISGLGEVLISFGATNANERIQVFKDANGYLKAFLSISGIGQFQIYDNVLHFSDGIWGMITITHDGVEPKLYFNGEPLITIYLTDVNRTRWISSCTSIDNARIGALNYNSSLVEQQFFNGTIDEVGIWTRALSATEISNLYNGGNGRQI